MSFNDALDHLDALNLPNIPALFKEMLEKDIRQRGRVLQMLNGDREYSVSDAPNAAAIYTPDYKAWMQSQGLYDIMFLEMYLGSPPRLSFRVKRV